MKYILLIAAFDSFFFSILLFHKRSRAIYDNLLIVWLVYLGFFIGIYSFYSHSLFVNFKLLSIGFISLFLLHGGFLYVYTLALISQRRTFHQKDLIHLVPFLLFNLYLVFVSYFPDESNRIRLDYEHLNVHPPTLFIIFLIITLLSGPFYFLLSIRLFKIHHVNIFNNFSYEENINLGWLRKIIFIFGIVWTALIIISVIHHVFNLFSMSFCTDGLFLSLSAFVILIGYFGLKQREIFSSDFKSEHEIVAEKKIKYSGSHLKDPEAKQYAEKLSRLMNSSKPFLNQNLTLPQLASTLGISSHYLSQVINEEFHLNFFDFVNQYRVGEVKSKMFDEKYKNYSLLGIALDSGFSSKSAFNRIFKKFTDQTPSQFISAKIKLNS